MRPPCPGLGPVSLVLVCGSLSAQLPSPPPQAQQQDPRATSPAPPAEHDHHLDIGLSILGALGASTERDDVLRDLQGGGHDPRKRGFTFQEAELAIGGTIEPWLSGQAYLVAFLDPYDGETIVELEEAFVTTRNLPAGLEVKGGAFSTEFGLSNPRHPHSWDWQDQPVINTRLFGADGMRGVGARVSWCAASGFALMGTIQNANGETMASFLANEEAYEERPVGGRLFDSNEVRSASDMVYTLRASTSFDPSDAHCIDLGASAAFGANATGGQADTLICGVDFGWRWQAAGGGTDLPAIRVQGEILARAFDAAPQTDASDPLNPVALPGETLDDHGGYVQGLYEFANGWGAGLRVDWASGSGESYRSESQTFDRSDDPFRADRVRISPLVVWRPGESARIRLQYNYDDSDHLDDPSHSVWLGFEVQFGSHPHHAADASHAHDHR